MSSELQIQARCVEVEWPASYKCKYKFNGMEVKRVQIQIQGGRKSSGQRVTNASRARQRYFVAAVLGLASYTVSYSFSNLDP